MAFKLAEAFVQLSAKGFTSVETGIARIKASLISLGSATGIAGALSLTGLALAITKSIHAAEQADKAQRRLHATIRLLGEGSGITAMEINEIAKALANTSEFDDDAIAKASASLLEFGNIAPTTLKRAIPVAIDLASRTGDLEGTFRALGAALSDPINSLGLLRRQYRAFSADVLRAAEELARSGDVIGAQKLILDELAKHTQGMAAAMVTPLDKAKNALSEMAEAVGTAMAPTVEWFAKGTTAIAKFYEQLARGAAQGRGPEQLKRSPVDEMNAEVAKAQERAAKGRARMGPTPTEIAKEKEVQDNFRRERRAAAAKDRQEMLADMDAAALEGPDGARDQFIRALEKRLEKLKELYATEKEIERQRGMAMREFDRKEEARIPARTGPVDTRTGIWKLLQHLGPSEMEKGRLAQGDIFKQMMESLAPDSDQNPLRRRLEIEFNAAQLEKQINQVFPPGEARDQAQGLAKTAAELQQKELTQGTRKAPEFVGLVEMSKRIQQAVGTGKQELEKQQVDFLKRIVDLAVAQGLNVNIKNVDELMALGEVGI